MIQFSVLKKSKKSLARLGILKTPHGVVETPALVTVATQAVVKTLTSEEAAQAKGTSSAAMATMASPSTAPTPTETPSLATTLVWMPAGPEISAMEASAWGWRLALVAVSFRAT